MELRPRTLKLILILTDRGQTALSPSCSLIVTPTPTPLLPPALEELLLLLEDTQGAPVLVSSHCFSLSLECSCLCFHCGGPRSPLPPSTPTLACSSVRDPGPHLHPPPSLLGPFALPYFQHYLYVFAHLCSVSPRNVLT